MWRGRAVYTLRGRIAAVAADYDNLCWNVAIAWCLCIRALPRYNALAAEIVIINLPQCKHMLC